MWYLKEIRTINRPKSNKRNQRKRLDFCNCISYTISTARETKQVGGQEQKGGRHGRYGHDGQAV